MGVRSVFAIAGRELASAFGQPLAYAVLSLFLGGFSLLTLGFDDLLYCGVASLRQPFFWLWGCLLFVAPATSMRSFADEWRTGTWSVLGTLPVSEVEVVGGKWLATSALLWIALLLTLPWPVSLVALADPDVGTLLGGYLGLALGAAALAAIGVAASAWTESVVVAFLGAFVVGFVPWLAGFALPLLPSGLVPVVETLSLHSQFERLARGVFDSSSAVFFLAITAFALRLAVHAVQHRRLG
jgi:ABC-2 type transport system permease protein